MISIGAKTCDRRGIVCKKRAVSAIASTLVVMDFASGEVLVRVRESITSLVILSNGETSTTNPAELMDADVAAVRTPVAE